MIIAGAVAGLLSAGLKVSAANKAEEAAANEALAAAEEQQTQTDAFAELSARRLEEMGAQQEAMDQRMGFQMETAQEQGRRAIGSAEANVGASGLRGGSKTSVLDQLSGDIDRQLGQMDVERTEANRAATEAIGLQAQADAETIRQGDYAAALLEAQGNQLMEDSELSLLDIGSVLLGGVQGGLSGASIGLGLQGGGGPTASAADVNVQAGGGVSPVYENPVDTFGNFIF